MFKVSKISNMTDGQPIEVTFDQLIELVTINDWSPAIFKDGKRKKTNYLESEIIALDFDSGLSLDNAINEFEAYKHIIGTSRNHQKEKNGVKTDRFRVILFLSDICKNTQKYEEHLKKMLEVYPDADQACKDASRFFYPCTTIVSTNRNGALIELSDSKVSKNIQKIESNVSHEDFLENFLRNGTQKGRRNNDLFKASCIARNKGKSQEWCVENLTSIVVSDDFTDDEALRTIESAFDRDIAVGKFSKFVLSSLLVVNVKDTKEAYLVNLDNQIKSRIAQTRVKEALGSDLYSQYKKDEKVKYCDFEYNPKNKQIFIENSYIDIFNSYDPAGWFKKYFYSGEKLEILESMPRLYEDFFKFLTDFDSDPGSYNYLLDWLANILQGRNKTILTLIANQGVGKGVLGDIIKALVGNDNFSKVRDTVLKGKFNKHIGDKIVVNIDEIDIKNNTTAYDRLKDLVNDTIEIEGKGLDAENATNFANFFISSNRTDCIRIEADNRRFSIIQLTDTPLREVDLIENVLNGEYFKDSNIKELAQYLYGHKIKHNMLEPFVDSSRFNEIKEDSTHEWERWIIDMWAITNIDKQPLRLSDFLRDCKQFISVNGKTPGQRKIIDLARRYPDKIRISQPNRLVGDASRYIESVVLRENVHPSNTSI